VGNWSAPTAVGGAARTTAPGTGATEASAGGTEASAGGTEASAGGTEASAGGIAPVPAIAAATAARMIGLVSGDMRTNPPVKTADGPTEPSACISEIRGYLPQLVTSARIEGAHADRVVAAGAEADVARYVTEELVGIELVAKTFDVGAVLAK
jgi:hypothetical protein